MSVVCTRDTKHIMYSNCDNVFMRLPHCGGFMCFYILFFGDWTPIAYPRLEKKKRLATYIASLRLRGRSRRVRELSGRGRPVADLMPDASFSVVLCHNYLDTWVYRYTSI